MLADNLFTRDSAVFLAGGTMGAMMRDHDWSTSPLGAPEAWPQSLRSVVGLLLASKFPMFVAWGPGLGFLYNDAYAEILGAKHPRALGLPFQEIWAEIWPDISPLIDAALAGQATYREDLPLVVNRKNFEETAWFTFSYSPVRDETGQVAGMFCTVVETTGRVLAERRIAAESERLARMFEQAPGFITILKGPDHVFDFANGTYRRLFGDRDFVGKTAREVFPDLEGQDFFELLDRVYATGERFAARQVPIRLERTPGGPRDERWLDFLYEPIMDEAGAVIGIFVEGHDVTEARSAEIRLRESEARLSFLDRLSAETAALADADAVLATTTRLLGEQMGGAICAYADMDADQDGFTIRGDWAALGSLSIRGRYRLADFGRLAVANLRAGEPLVLKDIESELAPEEAATFQAIGIAATICMPLVKDGRLVALMAIHDRVPRAWTPNDLALLREVTARSWAHVERVGAMAELSQSEAQFRAFTQAVPNHVWAANADGALFWFNEQVYAYSGMTADALQGTGWTGIVHPDDLPDATASWLRSVATEEVYETEFRIRRADGRYRWFLVRAEPVRGAGGEVLTWVGTNTDIHDRRRAEAALRDLNDTLEQRVTQRTAELEAAQEQLRQSQKLEAMGSLTGGVAHDFNNLLTPIIASLDMFLRRGIGSERERRLMDGALQSAERAKTLVQRLLAFARRQPLQPVSVDVKSLMTGMSDLIASTSGPRIDVRVEMPDDLPPALADANQLEMAVLNLAVNARDAMPDGGVLTIAGTPELVAVGDPGRLRPGPYIRLSVRDTGIGMDEATLTRAIEPFFSTKGIGKGTGLGLSMAHGLASQLGGGLTITSRPGEGTTVELWLPVGVAAVTSDTAPHDAVTGPRGLGTALVVDDEDLVRMSTADMLMDLGYEVVEACSAEQALCLVEEGLAPDLLVTDHLMPGLSGVDLARDLRSRRPDLPVLVVSGYAEMEGLTSDLPRLTKPFRTSELAASLAALLRAP